VLSGDEAPPLKKYVALNGLTALTFWGVLEALRSGPNLIVQTILKFTLYVSILLWISTAFYLTSYQGGVDVETFAFQREQVKLSLWTVGILILMEIPMWISSI